MSTKSEQADRLPAKRRSDSIIEAAWAILQESGMPGLSIDAVVARVGVSRPIFYRHFSDRADLLAALYQDYADDLSRRTLEVIDTMTTIDDLLAGTIRIYLDCFEERGLAIRALVNYEVGAPQLDAARERLRTAQSDLLFAAVRRVGLRAPELETRLHIRLLQAAVMEAASALVSGAGTREQIEAAALRIERATVRASIEELNEVTP